MTSATVPGPKYRCHNPEIPKTVVTGHQYEKCEMEPYKAPEKVVTY